jgi:hypothetical protein
MVSIQDRTLDDLMQMMGQASPGSLTHTEATAEFNRRQFLNAQRTTTIAFISAGASFVSACAAWAAMLIHH